jgi:hypothetical protein
VTTFPLPSTIANCRPSFREGVSPSLSALLSVSPWRVTLEFRAVAHVDVGLRGNRPTSASARERLIRPRNSVSYGDAHLSGGRI